MAFPRSLAAAVLAVSLTFALAGCQEAARDLQEQAEGRGEGPDLAADGCPREPVLVERDLVVDALVATAGVGPAARQDFPLDVAGDWPAGVPWSCVRVLVATIAWSNGAGPTADLFVGLEAPSAGLSAVGDDRQQVFLPGDHKETVSVAAPADREALAAGITLVVYTDWPSVGPAGVPVHATLALEP